MSTANRNMADEVDIGNGSLSHSVQRVQFHEAMLPWNAGALCSPVLPPAHLYVLIVLCLATVGLSRFDRWLPGPVRTSNVGPVIEGVVNWSIAFGTAAAAVAASAVLLVAAMCAGYYCTPARRAIRQISSHYRASIDNRRWLIGALRLARRVRPSPWPGPGIICTGLQGLDWYGPGPLPSEGDWLKRTGFMNTLRDGDALASPIFLFFAVWPVIVATMHFSNGQDGKPIIIIMFLMALPFALRSLVGIGALFRGMFDAHIDAKLIDFGGPWITHTFERDQTIVFLIGAGPLVDATLIHRSGRRARLLLSRRGARKVLAVWGK